MTKKEKYAEIVKLLEGKSIEIDKEELIVFCQGEIALIDKKLTDNKKRAAQKPSPLSDELSQKLLSILTEEPLTISQILSNLSLGAEYQHKVTYRLSKLPGLTKSEVKIRDSHNRLVPRVAYSKKEENKCASA